MPAASPRQLVLATAVLVGVGVGCAGGSQERLPTSPPLASASAYPTPSTTTVLRCARLGARHGAVTCIDELTVEQASHRALSFWLTVRDGRAIRMERRDGAGAPSPASNGMFALDYVYEGGAIVERVARRPDGSVVMRTLYADGGTRRTWLDAQGRPWMQPREEGNIALYELDDAGRDRVERMVRADGSPRRDSVGVHVWKYAYDEQGRVVEERAFGVTGEPVHTRDGWHIHHRGYGKLGCEDSETYLGLDGSWCSHLAASPNTDSRATPGETGRPFVTSTWRGDPSQEALAGGRSGPATSTGRS